MRREIPLTGSPSSQYAHTNSVREEKKRCETLNRVLVPVPNMMTGPKAVDYPATSRSTDSSQHNKATFSLLGGGAEIEQYRLQSFIVSTSFIGRERS